MNWYFSLLMQSCGHCVDTRLNQDEMYGLDRCMVCGGNSSCVGCDGIVNSNYKTDACGMCLPKNDPKWNGWLPLAVFVLLMALNFRLPCD